MKQNLATLSLRCAVFTVMAARTLAIAVIPASAQNAVPPTAREAASMPAFASRLHPSIPQAANKSPASAHSRTRRPAPLDGLIYDNGPVNGTVDAWTINFGFVVSDSFPAAQNNVSGFDFGAWEFPGDTLLSVDWSITTDPNGVCPGSTCLDSGTAGVTDSFISSNQFGFNIDEISVSGLNVSTGEGTVYLNLQNAVVNTGDPIYWDENSGPSLAYQNEVGTIPSEAFNVVGSGGCSSNRSDLPQSAQARTYSVTAPPAPAQTFRVIHNFTGGQDGGYPQAGLTIDQAGNLYGPAYGGGQNYLGNIYKLYPHGSEWTFSVLYSFQGGNDGAIPEGRLTIGPYGTLYGTTTFGGGNGCYAGMGCGTVFAARPSAHATTNILGGWTDTVLYSFTGGSDGSSPASDLVFDEAGNLYGTMGNGGTYGKGAVYELVPTAGGWAYRVVYSFSGGSDGAKPIVNVMLDPSGNLYGATYTGGSSGCGTIFELTPSGSGWTEKTLYTFRGQDDSGNPLGLVMDQAGNLYGVTIGAGCLIGNCPYGVGASTVFMLSPQQDAWKYSVISNYSGLYNASISIDTSGSLYVAVAYPSYVFRLAPSGGTWTFTDLHDFNGSDGFWPVGNATVDAEGNIYGVTNQGGAYNAGVVWEISP